MGCGNSTLKHDSLPKEAVLKKLAKEARRGIVPKRTIQTVKAGCGVTEASSGGRRSKSATLIFLDWDGTLFPSECYMGMGGLERRSLSQEHLRCIAQEVKATLCVGATFGDVVILTAANEAWFLKSASMLEAVEPGTMTELKCHKAVFAVHEYRMKQPIVLGKPLLIDRTEAKAWAMSRELKRHIARGHEAKKNLVSIGNGPEERDALWKVGPQWGADVKTLKFLDVSSGPALHSQLALASLWLPAICHTDASIHVDFADAPAKLFAHNEEFKSLQPAAAACSGG